MLYSADVDSVAKPVKEIKEKVSKKQKEPKEKGPAKKRKTLDEQMVEKQLEIQEKEKELEEALKPVKLEAGLVTPPPSIAEPEMVEPEKVTEKVAPVEKIKVVKEGKDENEPPAWFKTFIGNAKQQESRIKEPKKPRKQVKVEAEKIAQAQWNDEYTRNRYNQQADQHLRKMHQLYNQMFYR